MENRKTNLFEGLKYPNGDVYKGKIINGKRNGYGILILSSGIKVEGSFLDDIIVGQCIINDEKGNVYIGFIENGSLNGKCVIKYANNESYEGYVKDNKKCGQGRFTFADGSFYLGEFKEDKFNGKGTIFNEKGILKTGYWVDGVLEKNKNI